MTINFVKTQPIGQSGQSPKIIYIDTNDTLATVTATGYLDKLARSQPISEGDAVLITTKVSPSAKAKQLSFLDPSFVNGTWTLESVTSPSTVASVTGTAGRITTTGTTNVTIDIAASYVGQSSITTLGTITTGTWNADPIGVSYGGTGGASFTPYTLVAAGASAASPLTSISGTGTTGQILVSQGAGAYPIWQTVAGGGDMLLAGVQTNTGAKTFDSGTLILAGATSGTITLNAAATAGTQTITLPAASGTIALTSDIPADPVPLANGGTGAALTASNGGVFYSTGSAGAILAGTATAGKMLRSGATAAPTWSTATFPNTATNANRLLRADGTNWVESTVNYANSYNANEIVFASSANTLSGLATVNNGVLVTNGSGVPSFSTTLPASTLSNITTVGTVTSGTWQADTITVPYGGTGNTTFTAYSVICAGATATGAFQNVSGVGTSGQVLTSNGAGALPTWQSAASAGTVNAGTINELAYYAANGTTVSGLTTGNDGVLITSGTGVPSISSTIPSATQLNITSLGTVTAGTWNADVLSLTYGGTNKALTAVDGGIVYTDANSMEVLAATATAGQVLLSGSNSAPSWSTPTYPSASGTAGKVLRADGTNNVYSTSTFADTYAASSLLYSNGANAVEGLAKTNNAVLGSDASGVPNWLALTDGEIVIGSAAGAPAAATITAGTGISIANGNNSIEISATGSGAFTWNEVAGTTQAAAVNNGYICQNASDTTVTLPATCAVGDIIKVQGAGGGNWILAANTGQTIAVTSSTSTTTAGNLTASDRYDYVEVQCIVANTTWVLSNSDTQGITIN